MTFKSGSSQNGRFQGETGGRELPTQNGSLSFKTGELEHMGVHWQMHIELSLQLTALTGGTDVSNNADLNVKCSKIV